MGKSPNADKKIGQDRLYDKERIIAEHYRCFHNAKAAQHRLQRTSAGLPTPSGLWPQDADSAAGDFARQVPPLPVKPAVEQLKNKSNFKKRYWLKQIPADCKTISELSELK